MKSFVAYTAARLGLFLASFAVVWAIGRTYWAATTANLLWAALLALVISAVASLVLLRGLRNELARDVAARADRIATRYEAARAREDSED